MVPKVALSPPAPTTPYGLEQRAAKSPRTDPLKGIKDSYDVVVIGSGLAGMTAANRLARCGHQVLLLEAHYNFGGMATWFKRKGGHIFDISLHGFPVGMKKTCRKYWSKGIADSIVQLKSVRFDNPQFNVDTTFDRTDFVRILTEEFGVPVENVEAFFQTIRGMNFFDDQSLTTRALFERFFPGRSDVHRLLMEPIAYANGSTLDDPAITFGIVFSNFMSQGVFTFQGGTNLLIKAMKDELIGNGVDLRNYAPVEQVLVTDGEVRGVVAAGRKIAAKAVLSNANLKRTVHELVGEDHFQPEFVEESRAVRLNTSSCQVYLGIRHGERIPYCGDLLFTSTHPHFDADAICALKCTSRTYSFYYPDIRPGSDMYSVVCSINARHQDWATMTDGDYMGAKETLAADAIHALEKYVPDVRAKIDHVEVSTPRTFKYYTHHLGGASFGTKFEGLAVSRALPQQVSGLFHAGSVGIIMSGWLGAANYGVIVSNEVDRYLGPVHD